MNQYNMTRVSKHRGSSTQIMVGVSENAVYFSSRFRKDMGLVPDTCFSFSYDKEEKAIAIQKADCKDETTYKLNEQGYCKLRISRFIPRGRYIYESISNSSFIFKLES